MKKALILSLGRSGSLPLYAENIVKSFKEVNYSILISKNRNTKNQTSNSIEVTTYSNKTTFILNTLFYLPVLLIRFVPKIYREYDILYLPYKHFWDIPFIFLFKLFGKKVLFTVHDGVLHQGEKNFLTQGLNNFRLKKASTLIFLTSFVKNLVKEELRIDKKSVIIPHPIIENNFIDFDKRKETTKNILFLGRIDQYKGVELLMESVLTIKNDFDKLIIAGKSQYNVNYISDSKIEIIDKYLSEKEMGELLTWANVLVLPYTEATQSGVIALGIYAELLMVCSKVGGFREQLNSDECLWCEPNLNDLAKELKVSLELNKKEKNQIVDKLKQKKKFLSWENISKMVETNIKN